MPLCTVGASGRISWRQQHATPTLILSVPRIVHIDSWVAIPNQSPLEVNFHPSSSPPPEVSCQASICFNRGLAIEWSCQSCQQLLKDKQCQQHDDSWCLGPWFWMFWRFVSPISGEYWPTGTGHQPSTWCKTIHHSLQYHLKFLHLWSWSLKCLRTCSVRTTGSKLLL